MSGHEELLATWSMRATAERYAMAVDRGDADMFAAQFTPGGILEAPRGRFSGREQLASVPPMMRRLYERTHHAVVGLVPVVEGSRATAHTYTHARHYYRDKAGQDLCYEMTIRYEDIFEDVEGAWLIAHRVLVLVGDATYPTGRSHRPADAG
ncbi:nuclear transport factor 2 family protein [uncultured Alsobacter sp.]|uniref:nuclear transport factor 2 family protein n=1 Tax=uncultured Alsobacter sp. TaxID=1748258 RepID=UPI0025EA677A|nr:nuclear transport factor 2 family protein [uncultured Alsobacter sp.]